MALYKFAFNFNFNFGCKFNSLVLDFHGCVELVDVFSLCEVGVVKLYVNRWVPISFILLPKAHLSILPGIGSPPVIKV